MSDLEIEREGGVAVLTINRADQHNTVGGTLFADFLAAARELDNDDSVTAVITTATGTMWCASADFGNLREHMDRSADDMLADPAFAGEKGLPILSPGARRFDRLGLGRWVLAFLGLQKPIIAALNGSAAAAGLSIALLHDIRFAADTARFRPGFLSLGAGPELGLSLTLTNAVGLATATDLLLTDRKITAAEALEIGLVHRVLPAEDVLPAAVDYGQRLAALPPAGVRATVRALRAVAHRALQDQLELEWDNQRITLGSPDFQAAVRAAMNRASVPRETTEADPSTP